MTTEHKLSIAMANTRGKRNLSDDVIRQILVLCDAGKTQAAIMGELGVSRDAVSKVSRKLWVPLDELEDHAVAMQARLEAKAQQEELRATLSGDDWVQLKKQQLAVAKRKILPEQILTFVDIYATGNAIASIVAANPGLTTIQVRKAVIGDTALFEWEFPIQGRTYEDYKTALAKGAAFPEDERKANWRKEETQKNRPIAPIDMLRVLDIYRQGHGRLSIVSQMKALYASVVKESVVKYVIEGGHRLSAEEFPVEGMPEWTFAAYEEAVRRE